MRALALLLAAASGAAGACEPGLSGAGVARLESPHYVLAYRSVPAAPKVGDAFSLDIAVCAKDDAPLPASLEVDAHMPEHRHGMNYAPSVEPRGKGRWRADGLLFHMPGHWQYSFVLRAASASERLTHDTTLD